MAKAKKEKLPLEELLEQAIFGEEDRPYEVPVNWVWTKISSISEFERGITFPASAKESTYAENLIACIRTANIQEDLDISNLLYVDRSFMKNNKNKLLRKDDVLMSSANSRELVGKVSYINDIVDEMTFGGFVLNIRAKGINSKFLFYFLRYEFLCGKFRGESTQTTNIANINSETLGNYAFPLPPLAEQQRIVEVIESLFEKLDTAKELVQNALDSFENRKAAILHKAFTGELTKMWREDQVINNENFAKLILETIKEFKEKEQKKFDKTDLITDDEIPFVLPVEWMWCRLGDIQEVSSGIQKTPKRKPDKNPIPYLAVANVRRGYVDLDQVKEFEVSNEEVEKFLLKYNDILIIEGNGSANEIGRCAIWKEEIKPCVHQNHIIKSRNYLDLILPEYILYYLNSSMGMELMRSKAKTTAGLFNLSTGKVKEIVIPIPSLPEQKEIVRILDNLLEKEQKSKELSEVVEKIDLMKKAILARAFRGELGTNNPEDESAVELLKEVLKVKHEVLTTV